MTHQPAQPYTVVVPTLGRPSLQELLASLASQSEPLPVEVVLIDDRPDPEPAVPIAAEVADRLTVRVVPGLGRGPAAARNVGWRLASTEWVAFLDDDVRVPAGWTGALAADLGACGSDVAATQGRLHVPLPSHRPPTDWERSTAGLETAAWATADMAYRRTALAQVEGFDERFPRAYREDADLALRVQQAGWSLVRGRRRTEHPVRPVPDGISVRVQRGNSDDALMRRLHGPAWRQLAGTGRGRLPWHVATVAAGLGAVVGCVGALVSAVTAGPAAPRAHPAAVALAVTWTVFTADFARRRIVPGPRDRRELVRMLWTSVAIPPAAVWHRLAGTWRHRDATSWPPPVRAVLFDRDGTLVHDVPYNGDTTKVRPVDGAHEAVERLRSAGIAVGVVSNQSGIARGLIDEAQVRSVNAEIERQLGPFGTWQVCPHGPGDGCACRKPQPGMVRAGAHALGVAPEECAVIGDIGADVLAARAAGARAVLVPTAATRAQEVRDAPVTAPDLATAVDLLLATRTGARRTGADRVSECEAGLG